MCARIIDGSIQIRHLHCILEGTHRDQFIHLHMSDIMCRCVGVAAGEETGKKLDRTTLILLLESRREELEEFERQWKWNMCFLRMCTMVEEGKYV